MSHDDSYYYKIEDISELDDSDIAEMVYQGYIDVEPHEVDDYDEDYDIYWDELEKGE